MHLESTLRTIPIYGIGSALNDLSLISDRGSEIADPPLQALPVRPISGYLKDLPVRAPERPLRIGDVIVFQLAEEGSFRELEITGGVRVPLSTGRAYVGVLGESLSLSHFTSNLELNRGDRNTFDLISVAGMVSRATSFSRDLELELGCGRAAKVLLLGAVWSIASNRPLNTLVSVSEHSPRASQFSIPSVIGVFGTATNVGKTTTSVRIINQLRRQALCGAIKATGTGSHGDTRKHKDAGALFALDFMRYGLPSTYGLPDNLLVSVFHRMIDEVEIVLSQTGFTDAPRERGAAAAKPLILMEFGGDLISAGNLAFVTDKSCISRTLAIVVCSDNAVAAIGAVNLLRDNFPEGRRPEIYLAMPLVNPEAFFQRMRPYLRDGSIAGIFDLNRPDPLPTEEHLVSYAVSGGAICSVSDLCDGLSALASEFRDDPKPA
ncbi:hypothetical protein GOD21_30635 [Sinorhizobium medicae]|nr:hypothetical protein [Sinorhizobium medicae]